ncbi:MAG: hypothetical protein IKP73_14475 [Bacteroidales bacterium]|nr:hypothetical protein [Bacteroidales bacterium]
MADVTFAIIIIIIVAIVIFLIIIGWLLLIGLFQKGSDGISAWKRKRKEKQEKERIMQEKQNLENDDMREIKKIMAAIPEKINALNDFTKELNEKRGKLSGIASQAIQNAYGEYSGMFNSIYRYQNEWKAKYSQSIDPIIALQCDKIVSKVSEAIDKKSQLIDKNNADIVKYRNLYDQLQLAYDREFKIQKMKKINSNLSVEISNSEGDLATSIYKGYSLENVIKDFQQLNLAMDERRNYEIQYGQIEI